jgi:hypothetical protein
MDKDTNTTIVVETPHVPPPVIIDLGRRKKKAIRKLKKGRGKLIAEVDLAVEQYRAALSDGDGQKQLIPVVIIYKKKRRGGGGGGLLPFNPFNLLR